MYRELLRYVEPDSLTTKMSNGGGTYPNLFDAHPPCQIDGNFEGAAATAEMLVQSDENNIYLLPAFPDTWQKGSVKRLRCRGSFEIDIPLDAGKLRSATVYAKGGEVTQLVFRENSQIVDLSTQDKRTFKPF
jgi:alpha-L-fucosidase 2